MEKTATLDLRTTNTISIKKSIISLCIFLAAMHTFLGASKIISKPSDSVYNSVDGFVLSSDIETHAIETADASHSTTLFYDAVVRFQYIVNGKTYVNSQILGNTTRRNPAKAQEVMATYSEGKVVRILFTPQAPSFSKIDTSSAVLPVPYFLMGIVFVLAAILAHRMIKVNTARGSRTATTQAHVTVEDLDAPCRSPYTVAPSPKPQAAIAGTWTLEFQVPSMREIIASTQPAGHTGNHDRDAVMLAGKSNLTVTISNHEIEFTYKDEKNQGSCEILSHYFLEGNTLFLEHKRMDFLMVDIQDFPPKSYTYTRKGSTLILTSNEIRGLGNKKISYHLSRTP